MRCRACLNDIACLGQWPAIRTKGAFLCLLRGPGETACIVIKVSLRGANVSVNYVSSWVRKWSRRRHCGYCSAHRCGDPDSIWIITGTALNLVTRWKEGIKTLNQARVSGKEM